MKKNPFWLKAALWTCGFGAFSDGVVVPLTNLIFEEFPDSGVFMQNMILSGSSLFALLAAVICGFLVKKADLRKILIVGSACFLIGGVGGCLAPNLGVLLLTRIIDGASDGILGVAALSAISRLYQEESEKSVVFGGYNSVSALFGLIVSTLSGIIALRSWRLAFLCNGISAIGLILVILFVPSMPPETEEEGTLQRPHSSEKILLALLTFCVSASIITQTYYLADVYVAEHQIGNSVQSGTLLSILTICNLFAGVAFPFLYKYLKRVFKSFIFLITGLSLIILFFGYRYLSAAFGLGLAGFIEGTGAIYYSMYVSEKSPKANIGLYIALYNITLYVEGFLAPYVPQLVKVFTKTDGISDTFVYSAIFSFAFAVYFLITRRLKDVHRKRN